jgi:hypothetical protein
MPNWNSNGVTINAPLNEVKKYLVFNEKWTEAMFNMHLLFPELFNSSDVLWDKNWNYDWAVINTGTKWFPMIKELYEMDLDVTYLWYKTARWPNNLLLKKLHKLTNWAILNHYEEPGMGIRWILKCKDWKCEDVIYED